MTRAFLLALMLLAQAVPASDGPLRKLFADYLEALNRHDIERTMRFYADDISLNRQGVPNGFTRADLRRFREWEAVMNARFESRILRLERNSVVVEMTESNTLNSALGVRRPVLTEYRFRNARIYWIDVRKVTDLGKPLPEQLERLEQWLAAKPPEQTAGLLENGRLIYTAAAAKKLLPFLKQWQALNSDSQTGP